MTTGQIPRKPVITTGSRRRGEPGMAWGTPKTAKGRRSVAVDPATVAALRQHRARQLAERLAAGEAYDDGDLVVCQADGTPVDPKTLSYTFEREIRRAGSPPIRLHDLRHTHATLALRAGVHPRVVQERLGTPTCRSRWIPTRTSTWTCRRPRPPA
jgi:integrase